MTTEIFAQANHNNEAMLIMYIRCAKCKKLLETIEGNEMISHLNAYHKNEIESVVCDECRAKGEHGTISSL